MTYVQSACESGEKILFTCGTLCLTTFFFLCFVFCGVCPHCVEPTSRYIFFDELKSRKGESYLLITFRCTLLSFMRLYASSLAHTHTHTLLPAFVRIFNDCWYQTPCVRASMKCQVITIMHLLPFLA